jgi:hypothetical protein
MTGTNASRAGEPCQREEAIEMDTAILIYKGASGWHWETHGHSQNGHASREDAFDCAMRCAAEHEVKLFQVTRADYYVVREAEGEAKAEGFCEQCQTTIACNSVEEANGRPRKYGCKCGRNGQ